MSEDIRDFEEDEMDADGRALAEDGPGEEPVSGHIQQARWGRDHHSLVLYIEARMVDHGGTLKPDHLRMRARRFPCAWDAKYGTRLADGEVLPDHDDLDCLDDLAAEGIVMSYGTGINPAAHLTDVGWTLAAKLRRERAMRTCPGAQVHASAEVGT